MTASSWPHQGPNLLKGAFRSDPSRTREEVGMVRLVPTDRSLTVAALIFRLFRAQHTPQDSSAGRSHPHNPPAGAQALIQLLAAVAQDAAGDN
jgi:hypothetical protein